MSNKCITTYANALRRMALPLTAYYTVTLAVPLANGAASSDATFLKHVVVVLIVPLGTLGLGCVVTHCGHAAKRWLANHASNEAVTQRADWTERRRACIRNWL